MINFDTYIKMGEPGGKERAEAWKTAIGLQILFMGGSEEPTHTSNSLEEQEGAPYAQLPH